MKDKQNVECVDVQTTVLNPNKFDKLLLCLHLLHNRDPRYFYFMGM